MITKYKSTNCIGNVIGRDRKRKTAIHTDRVIQLKINTNRRISWSSVKVELQNEPNITISETTIRRRAPEVGLFGRVASKKPYVHKRIEGNDLSMPKRIDKSLLGSGIM